VKKTFLLYSNLSLFVILIIISYSSLKIISERQVSHSASILLEQINWLENDYKNKTGKYVNNVEDLAQVFFIEANQPTPKNKIGLPEGKKYPYNVIVFSHPNATIYRALIVAEGDSELDDDKYPEIWWISSKEQKVRSLKEFPKK
jgi:hypothetical protein